MLIHDYDTTIYNVEAMKQEWFKQFEGSLQFGSSYNDAALDAVMYVYVYQDDFRL